MGFVPACRQPSRLAQAGAVSAQGGGVSAARLEPVTRVLYLTPTTVFWRLLLRLGPYKRPTLQCLCQGCCALSAASQTASLQPITSCHITFSHRILSEDAPRSQKKLEWLQSMRCSQRYATSCAWASQLPVSGSPLGAAFCLPCQDHRMDCRGKGIYRFP